MCIRYPVCMFVCMNRRYVYIYIYLYISILLYTMLIRFLCMCYMCTHYLLRRVGLSILGSLTKPKHGTG